VAGQAHIILAADVITRIGPDFAGLRVADLAVWVAADRMRDLRRRSIRIGSRRNGRRKDFGETDRVQTSVAPLLSVASAVRAERSIVFSAGIVRVVALLARCIESRAVLREPCRGAMRLGLFRLDHRNDRRRAARCSDFGQCMTDIALEANGVFVICREMLAVMAAEATWRILVTDIVRVSRPRKVLR
jgi:hypothetical protein